MLDHLLSVSEAASYLSVDEKRLKELVRKKIVPAYKIGGSYLRFRKDQLDIAKSTVNEPARQALYLAKDIEQTRAERIKDFIYFNDFYVISIILVVIAVAAIFTS